MGVASCRTTTYSGGMRNFRLNLEIGQLFCAKIDFSLDNHIQRNVLNVVLFYVVFTICMYTCDLSMFSMYILLSSIIVKGKSI